jgi:hypothetical protein
MLPEGRHVYAFEFSDEERQNLRKLLFAVLTEGEVSQQGAQTKDESPVSSLTFDEFDSSDETATTASDPSDEFSEDEFSDDDAQ